MKPVDKIDVPDLIRRCRTEGMEAITEVYKRYRNEFLSFARQYNSAAPRETLLNAWHDAVIDFYEIALAGRYDPQKSSLKTFLFSIGKYKLLNQLKKEGKNQFLSIEENDFLQNPDFSFLKREQLAEKEQLIKKGLDMLGEKCRELLILIYYRQYSSEAVQIAMNYGNANVVYSHKSRCLKQLKAILQKQFQF